MEIIIKSNQSEEVAGLTPEYPYVLHRADLSHTRIPWHWHDEVEFDYITEGEIEIMTPNQTYLFHRGDAFFINANILHAIKDSAWKHGPFLDSHLFHPTFLSGHFKSIFEQKYIDPVIKNHKFDIIGFYGENTAHRKIIDKLRAVSRLQEEEDREFQTRNLFSEIWLLLMKEIKRLEENGTPVRLVSQERIQTMLAYIHQHYMEKITLEEIASSASVSKRECMRCFQNSIKKTPFEYLLEYRIQMAEQLLRQTNEPITAIALQTGFSNSAYFGKIFKKLREMSPGAYRSQNH